MPQYCRAMYQHAQGEPFPLQSPFGPQQWRISQRIPVLLEHVGPDDQVDQAIFVLQGDKDMSLGRRRPLADDDQPGNSDHLTILPVLELTTAQHIPCLQ